MAYTQQHHLTAKTACSLCCTAHFQFSSIKYKPKPSTITRLFTDIMHIISGLRPAFLVDYFPFMSAHLLADAASTVLTSLSNTDNNKYAICSIEDAHFFVNISHLRNHNNKAHNYHHHAPLFIEFTLDQSRSNSSSSSSTTLAPTWASEDTRNAQLHTLHDIMQDIDSTIPPLSTTPSRTSIPIFDLTSKLKTTGTGSTIRLPTLSGYLLDYPVIYTVKDMEHSQSASRCLSSCTLNLYSVHVVDNGDDDKDSDDEGKRQLLLAFSLPRQLAEDACWKETYKGWKQKYCRVHPDYSYRLEIECESCCRPVSL